MAEFSAQTEADSQSTSLFSAYCFYWVKIKKSNEVSNLRCNTSVWYLELQDQSSARSSPLKTKTWEVMQRRSTVLICSLPEISPWSLDFLSMYPRCSPVHPVTGTDTCQLCLASSLRQDTSRKQSNAGTVLQGVRSAFSFSCCRGDQNKEVLNHTSPSQGSQSPQQQIKKAEWVPIS